ncbi:glycine--tRNA ligase subunit beta [Candidatus Electronema sp. PJ]|uniref:glycine--tRNA ligase subunit beta n=1 Tax=Candidatus Electronema sp. PJ TaxID=3401572 RepID=UPI003AA9C3FD
MAQQLLFEIGTEEIPASYIRPALAFLEQTAQDKFKELGLAFGKVRSAGTPRRLTIAVDGLQEQQQTRRQEHVGPAKQAAYDANGQPTKAALGFARSRGLAVEDLQVIATAKGEYLMAVEEIKGRATAELLPSLLESLLRAIPFPKSMRWANSKLAFARPIQWLLALYDGKIVDVAVEDLRAGDTTLGHRFLNPAPVQVQGFADYLERLAAQSVFADLEQRRAMVVAEVKKAVREQAGTEAVPLIDEGLLDIVTNLVEKPHGVCGTFEEKFLALPAEVLITSMREHQKYFPVADQNGKLLPYFVAVNNTEIQDRELAVSGHQRVLRARLEDALFFFNEDKKKPLARRMDGLAGIIFQHKLGTMAEKSSRIAVLTAYLADQLAPALKADALRAAELAKADLLTAMVGEFPTLQGIIGRAYALLDGEKAEVAEAIREHYLPVRAGGELPQSLIGALVGLADRIDTIIGCFAIGERPTGSKDAFGQRRLALGLINIIRSQNLRLSLPELASKALAGYAGKIEAKKDTLSEAMAFIRLRFENDLLAAGKTQAAIEAATSVRFDDLNDCLARIEALEVMRNSADFAVLAGSFKRIANIIKDHQETVVDKTLLVEEAEAEFVVIWNSIAQQVLLLLAQRDYAAVLNALLAMKEPIDRFFEQVMVMDENLVIRQNRLNLLTGMAALIRQVGDISKMDVEQVEC